MIWCANHVVGCSENDIRRLEKLFSMYNKMTAKVSA